MHDDSPTHAVVDLLPIHSLERLLAEIVARRGTRRAESVVLQERVAVEKVDLRNRRLRDEIENVGAGAAETHDRDLSALELRRHRADTGTAGGSVHVSEDRLRLARFDRSERLRGHAGVDGLR